MRLITALCLALPLLLAPLHASAQAEPAMLPPVPAAPAVAARAHILVDFNSGAVLAENAADERMDPASITKLMTAYAVFSELRKGEMALDDMVTVSERAWRTGGSRMFIEVGTRVRIDQLIRGMIIQSGNDASVALAEHTAGTEAAFAQLMNEYARRLGMRNTNFRNATGLPAEDHYSSARDIALLAAAIIREFPEFYSLYSEREYTYNEITQRNRNKMLWRDPSVDGIKTGMTDAAGYCLVSSAERGDMRLISVLLGTSSDKARADATQALLNWGFRFFESHRVYAAGEPVTTARLWKGEVEELPLGLQQALWVTLPRGRYELIEATMELQTPLVAPVAPDDAVGRLRLTLEGESLADLQLYPLAHVAEGGLLRRALHSVQLWFE
ncbi:D-alanyl-D-alanine carboxypeptidase family protein [Thioalkalivibrio sp. XN279]|uniref:D-alanyl-D-alanine carboxypeptidase family protein n=1 Tax=Thioalkalivibrio sp. XN279 TaxID=2714953 RepID=UPI00140DABC3|nr:D-alanyl-D-alanine carboxypeptidase family protein [Thioalkalivibrio sp. XN279]NHA15040.1 D-alanyl-D-alanine carboxypeptidase [Thioalkalivibrio sp. XN279]